MKLHTLKEQIDKLVQTAGLGDCTVLVPDTENIMPCVCQTVQTWTVNERTYVLLHGQKV